jgi:hypothetical protein
LLACVAVSHPCDTAHDYPVNWVQTGHAEARPAGDRAPRDASGLFGIRALTRTAAYAPVPEYRVSGSA